VTSPGVLRDSNGNGRLMKHGQFHRIRRLPPYVFSEVNAMKAAARAAGHDIIDFGMGNPDGATPQPIVDKLIEAVRNARTHRYSTSRGIPGLRRAQAAYYQRRFGVALDPETEIVVTLGSKEGLANLAQAITAPGDVILAPNPSYPIHPYGFIIAGAAIRHVPLVPDGDLMAELAHATEHSVPPPTAIVLNFPSNPTGHVVELDFYREVVSFARRRDILLLSDLAYAEIYFGAPPPSILEVPHARDVAVEFTSLSKTYSMPGWRIGFAAGNAALIAALTRIKSYLDYGAFTPIQVAATAALNQCDAFVAENRTRYRERRDVLIEGLQGIGWPVPAPAATMFVWAPIPPPYRELGSLEFSKLLLREARVAVAPGLGFGEYGEGFVRFALVENRQRIRQAARNIKAFFGRSAPERARAVA
jgi:alanine-synthesizing transaminase